MEFTGLQHTIYSTAAELGRGGEGAVYELRSHPSLVLKLYSEPLTPERVAKLTRMAALRNDDLETYAAWPVDTVCDQSGIVCGFVMRRLVGYVPLHMLFSPMDRKKLFPDKGYNFLLHVARNLSIAFHKLHEQGLVVGDVNEGNILVNPAGMVAFIDCDSFQVPQASSGFYFCEVGVPRYTPPELLVLGSFDQAVRTPATDAFSMAVLVFQLLFLGRHPFAGKNKTNADIDEETAIRQKQFAYSLHNKKKKLSPPNDSFAIANLRDDVVDLFHRAFEQDHRPLAAEWVSALDAQLVNMTVCGESRLHTYPSQLAECPWCTFRRERGILYFLDDSYLHANAALSDIDHFVNGFRLEQLKIKPWMEPVSYPDITPAPVAFKYRDTQKRRITYTVFAALVLIALTIRFPQASPLTLSAILFIYKSPWWGSALKAEYKRLTDASATHRNKLAEMVREYERVFELQSFNEALDRLTRYVDDFKKLPVEFSRRKMLAEERLYNEQLYNYLYQFRIEDHEIPSIGAARKSALYNAGIFNAAQLSMLGQSKVAGIGPKFQQVLLSWQRQMSSGFTYIPNSYGIEKEMKQVEQEMANLKSGLEQRIKKEYQSINYTRQNFINRSQLLEPRLNDMARRTYQAEQDQLEFQKVYLRFKR